MLTPVDIENKMFKKVKLGGYDIDEVEDFLEVIIEDYEKLYKENAELKNKSNTMQDSVTYYKSIEDGINKTIESAQIQADSIKQAAIQEAETIKEKAEIEAKRNLEEIKLEILQAEKSLEEQKKLMQIYKIKVTAMLEAQLKILNEED